MKFSEWGEGRLLAWVAEQFRPASAGEGVGDDAALLKCGDLTLAVTTDAVVEGTHFRRDWFAWAEAGRRATYACLSDLAAMAARPRMVLLSLGVPPDLSAQDVRAFISATDAAAREFQAYLAGGDTVASPTFFADLMAIGEASQPTLRSGGKPGDALAVTGSLGAPAAAIALLTAGQAGNCPCWPVLRERLVSPRPRVEEALALADLGLHAAIDISDGLMLDAGRMADASGCSAILEAAKLPVAEGVEGAASVLGRDPVEFVASGGEEYELLLAVPPAVLSDAERILASLGCRLTTVGGLREGGGTVLVDAVGKTIELPAAGWEHYGTGS